MLIKEIYQKYKIEQKSGGDFMDIDGGVEDIKIGKNKNKKGCC